MITLTAQEFQALLILLQRIPLTLPEQLWLQRLADEKTTRLEQANGEGG
mgnify:CR=1